MKTRVYMAWVTPMSRTRPALVENPSTSSSRMAEQLDQQGAGHVEALGHGVGHLGVERVALAGDVGQTLGPRSGPAPGRWAAAARATSVMGHDR